jgi:hypothetical protein
VHAATTIDRREPLRQSLRSTRPEAADFDAPLPDDIVAAFEGR